MDTPTTTRYTLGKFQLIRAWTTMTLLAMALAGVITAKADVTDQPTPLAGEIKAIMKSVDEVKRLPITGMSMVKAGEQLFLISDNGHFAVAGNFKLVDMWQGKTIASVADTQGIDKIDLRKIGFNPDELGAFTIGHGPREVVIFTDPLCGHCQPLLSQLPALGESHTFKLVLIPAVSKDSAEMVKRLSCNPDRQQSLQSLLAKDYTKLPALVRKEGACDLKPLQKAVVATKLLDIQGVPTLFLPSKNVFKGGVPSFKTLLEKDREDEIHGR